MVVPDIGFNIDAIIIRGINPHQKYLEKAIV